MAYSELIKNFDNIRNYMRDFFIYGFKTREEYDAKSARSYDNERRRIQSYLGDLVSYRQTSVGKQMFISLDGRSVSHNPLHRAFKCKSFTDKDITVHFIVMDILADGESYTLKHLLDIIDMEYLSEFQEPMCIEESTLRKKLKEYVELGIVRQEKQGKTVYYSICRDELNLSAYEDVIRFFSEEDVLGVVGSYLEDKLEDPRDDFVFKNHYIMNAYDTEVLEAVLRGIHEKRYITVSNVSRRNNELRHWKVIPLKLLVSVQGGRNYLICESAAHQIPLTFRIDYIQRVVVEGVAERFALAKAMFEARQQHMWGVSHKDCDRLEHVEMDIHVGQGEDFIVRRLRRERRCGRVERVDDTTYRFVADVYDAYEMVPWIRTFIGRIARIESSNSAVVETIRADILAFAKMYGLNSRLEDGEASV